MPNRIIKESICTSETIAQLTWFEEVFFERLIVNCDDYGRFDARPPVIRGRLFPLKSVTDVQIESALNKLATVGIAHLYIVDEKPYLQLVTWDKHQRIRAHKSKYPGPEEGICCQMSADDSNPPSSADKCVRNPIQSESNPNPNPNPNPNTPGEPGDGVMKIFREYAGEDEGLLSVLSDFKAMRKQIKKPLTARAAQMIVDKLKALADAGNPPAQVLEQSIFHCWQGVFELKGGGRNGSPGKADGDLPASGEYGNYL